jgi:phage terminase small subunit
MALSDKQLVFINEYLICLNATEAARRAGYAEKYLHTNASKLLQNTTIQAAIQERLKEKHLSADVVLARLGDMATSNLSDFADIKTGDDLANARERGYVVKKFKREIITDQLNRQHEKIEIELYDAQSALVHIGKTHGLFADKVDHTGQVDIVNMSIEEWRKEKERRQAEATETLEIFDDE